MALAAQEQDKKKAAAKAGAKAKPADAAKPEVAKDKKELGAMMRPGAEAKLKVGGAGDKAEKEADKVADDVLKEKPAAKAKDGAEADKDKTKDEDPARGRPRARGPPQISVVVDNTVRRTAAQGGQPHLDSLSATPALPGNMAEVGVSAVEENKLDEMVASDYDTLTAGVGIQPKRMPGAGGEEFMLSAATARRIHDVRGGSGLPQALRRRIEDRLSVDLSGIRVHTGEEPARLCAALGARAFAHGRHIWLRSGAEMGDQRLLTHEVVHTIQQGAAPRRAVDPETARRGRPEMRPQVARAPPEPVLRRDEEDPGWLARGAERLADRLDSYGVLKVLIGRRLFTGQTVNPSAIDYVGAFMKFIGADETFEQMKQSGSLQKGFDEIRAGLVTYDITWDRVRRTFDRAYDEFEWTSPIESFTRIFGPFFRDVLSYGAHVLKIIAELVAEAFVIGFGPMGRAVWEKIKAIGDTIGLIISDPLGFAMNLIRAVGNGIKGFGERIWTHIKAGLLAWILGPFAAMGIQLPAQLDLKGIISVILQVLGLTYPQLRPRIVRALNPNGEVKVGVIERMIEVVNILRTEGLAGIWRKLMEYVENLQMTVINGIRDWVVRAVVQAGIRKLVAWSNPAGALIDILLTIYNLIVFFVERFQQILDFASSVFDSLGKIARGELGEAALAVEDAMAKTIPIIISFIVRLLGLPDIGGTIRRIITNIQARVHRAFDRVLEWIIKKVKKLIAGLVSRFRRQRGPPTNPVVLQGATHSMEVEEGRGPRKLVIKSEAVEMTAAGLTERCNKMEELCAPPITTQLLPRLRECIPKLRAFEEAEARTARLPEPNQDTPQVVEARTRLMGEIKALLEQGTLETVETAEEAESGRQEVDNLGADHDAERTAPREDQKDQVKPDLNEPTFRFIVLNDQTDGEGFSGPWKQAKERRKAIQDSVEAGGGNAKYLIELDHNPEWAILKRLAMLETDPPEQREGEAPGEPQPVFPGLHAQFSGDISGVADTNRDKGEGLMALATRREVNTSEINQQSGNYGTFDTLATWIEDRKRFRYKAGKAAEAPNWSAVVKASAEEHKRLLEANYARFLEVHDSSQEIVDAVTRNGASIISTFEGFMSGAVTAGEVQPGAGGEGLSGVGMRADPVAAELTEGPSYTEAVAKKSQLAPEFGRALQTHHMVEESVMRAIRDEMTEVKAHQAIRDARPDLLGFVRTGPMPRQVLAETLQGKTGPDGEAPDIEAEWAKLSDSKYFPFEPTAFPSKSPHSQGFAVNVLMQVNQQASAPSPEGALGSLRTGRGPALNAMVDAYNASISAGYGALGEDEATPRKMVKPRKDAHKALDGHIRGTLPGALRGTLAPVVREAAETAYDRFRPIQDASLAAVRPQGPDAKEYDPLPGEPEPQRRRVYQQLLERNAALTKERLVEGNLAIWTAA